MTTRVRGNLCRHRATAAVVVLASALGVGSPAGAQTPTADELVARAGTFVADFVTRFSALVAEERQTQRMLTERSPGGPSVPDLRTPALPPVRNRQTRELRSDFLL